MSRPQVERLVRMAKQIALNMAAWGDAAAVARQTGEHTRKFWTPAMCGQLLEYYRNGGEDLSPVVVRVVAAMDQPAASQEETS